LLVFHNKQRLYLFIVLSDWF